MIYLQEASPRLYKKENRPTGGPKSADIDKLAFCPRKVSKTIAGRHSLVISLGNQSRRKNSKFISEEDSKSKIIPNT